MATQIKYRRGSSVEHETFTGAIGEITVDTTTNTLVVHDGVTVGGKRQDKLYNKTFETVSELQSSKGLKVGDTVWIGERGWYFDVTSTETPDTFAIIDIDGSLQAKVRPISGFIGIEACGALPDPLFDSKPVISSAWGRGKLAKFFTTSTFYLGSQVVYPSNARELHGMQAAPFASNTSLAPMDDTFADVSLIDMNENGSSSASTGGQHNRLVDISIVGGMSDYQDIEDPLVDLIGVRGDQTIDGCNMVNVTFRNCGKPFQFTGWKHAHEKITVYQCHTGGDLSSTNSSVIDKYNIQTCYKNWGVLSGCTINDATIQQGNEWQRVADDIGMRCSNNVNFTGYLYTEGANAQIYVEDGETVTAEKWDMGFAILLSGSYGSSNMRVGEGSSIIVRGGKSGGAKSFLISGSPDLAENIHLDIEPTDGRFINSATGDELPNCPNLFARRTYGQISRVNNYNEITLPVYDIGISTVTLWDQFATPSTLPFGGEIEVHVGGSNSYDLYKVDFTDSTVQSDLVTINTIFRNVGGSGDNNINLSYAANVLTAQGRKSDQKIGVKVSAYGSMWPRPIV